jgi:hypothetical protein
MMTLFLTEEQLSPLFPEGDLEDINKAISDTICEYCNTTFELVERIDERYDSRVEITLLNRPIHEVTTISDDGALLMEDADFFVYEDKIVLESPSKKKKGVLITYISGFDDIPQTVKDVALELAKYRSFRSSEGNLLYYKSQKTEERAYEIGDNDEIDILSRLSRWVQPMVSKKGRGLIRIGYMNG